VVFALGSDLNRLVEALAVNKAQNVDPLMRLESPSF
jgi:hypothetical protein